MDGLIRAALLMDYFCHNIIVYDYIYSQFDTWTLDIRILERESAQR